MEVIVNNLTFIAFAFILLLNLAISHLSMAANLGNDTDKLALVDVKSHLTKYPIDVFSSWNDSVHFCMWKGVESSSNKQKRVIGLRLKGMNLYGTVSPSLGNLSFLQTLDLSQNSLSDEIPPELGRLARLQNLNLSFNVLSGAIPEHLSNCSHLVDLSLNNNILNRQIPWKLGALLQLERLSLSNNNLTGSLPASLGNLSSLVAIDVSYNGMDGEIPVTIGKLKKLTSFQVAENQFSGVFPPALYNLSSLELMALTDNKFSGGLRRDVGLLFPNIQNLWWAGNSFTGDIPESLSNTSNLLELDLSSNLFGGYVPAASLGSLQNLTFLNLAYNSLVDDDLIILFQLANCSRLQLLDISMNQFEGKLTASVANLSSRLYWLGMSSNRITGSIPDEIAGLVGLTTLDLSENLLTGNIPSSIGTLPKLQALVLGGNHLTGEIPSSMGNLTRLWQLALYNNSLQGNVPFTFSNLKRLQDARFCHNKFSGNIPPHLISLPSLVNLNLSHNSFFGSIPAEVGNLVKLTALDISHNNLSSEIPTNLALCLSLNTLNMENNFLQGSIPDLSQLRGLEYLDLSSNNFSGQIPDYFVKFTSLMNLNLSFNNFEGQVPSQGVFKNVTAVQIYGNSQLCGGIPDLNLQPCPVKKMERLKRHVHRKLILAVIIVSPCLLLLLLLLFFMRFRRTKKLLRGEQSSKSSFGRVHPKITFKDLYDSTQGFSSNNLIGAGSFGTVYMGVLGQGELPIAVKVLNLHRKGASRSFLAECRALRNIRHKNLVKLLTLCSGVDYKGHDFKAFVFPYMSNGSLDKWLHPEDDELPSADRSLNLLQRINIAIDIASALQYLHHQCSFPVIHCDLKPSNVLLDSDLTAHVSDFGLARLLSEFRGEGVSDQFSSLGIKGTVGYIAPEYGTGSPVSTLGDVYSYGILLLELFTGRRPVDETFEDNNSNLHSFAERACLDEAIRIIDESGLHDHQVKDDAADFGGSRDLNIDCLVSVLQIGITCSSENPRDRIDMRHVANKLVFIKEKLLELVIGDHENKGKAHYHTSTSTR